MYQKEKSRIALFLLPVLLLTAILAALPVSAAETEETNATNYDSYYAYYGTEDLKVAWDAFDRHTGETLRTETDQALFGTAGSFGEGYLSVSGTALNFKSAFANNGQTDYTLDLTVAMQNTPSETGTMSLGALSGLEVQFKTGIDSYPVDASYGIVSGTYRNLASATIATDSDWSKAHFLGKPLGQVYSFGISTHYEIANGTGTAAISLLRDAASLVRATVAYPVKAGGGNALDTKVFQISKELNFDYYALRYYERVLSEEELQLNHFVDLAKWFGISLEDYNKYKPETKAALHLALREETFDTLTRSSLQSIVDNFGAYNSALQIDDYITFEGFSAALYGTPGLRSIYTVDRTALKSLEKAGYSVKVGALVAIKGDRDIADITLKTTQQVIAKTVYSDGELTDSVLEETDDSFSFALTTRFDTQNSNAYYREALLYRAFMTLEKDGKIKTFYLDAESDTFGHSVTIEEISLLFAFRGETSSTSIKNVLGDKVIALARDYCIDYASVFGSRQNSETLAKDIFDYLFTSYQVRADIMAQTGVSGQTYTYANASPYYKLFNTSHVARDVAASETVALLLQCENAVATVNGAAEIVGQLYGKLETEQNSYKTISTLLSSIEAGALEKNLTTEEANRLVALLSSYVAAHGNAIADSVRDALAVKTTLQTVKGSLTDQTDALASLREDNFTIKDGNAFGTQAPLSSYVILSDEENESAAQILSAMLSNKYGVFVPFYAAFPASAKHALTNTISLLDASNLGENEYSLEMDGTNVQLLGKTAADARVAAVVFARALDDKITFDEKSGTSVSNLFDTMLPVYLEKLTVKTVENGGVMDRFTQVVEGMPAEYKVINPLSSSDYPLSTANTVYVSPEGKDTASGSYNDPFPTLERAFEYAFGRGGAQILLFGGTYKIDKPLTLSAMHSGSKESPLYISAMPGAEVLFTTADTITGFEPVTDENIKTRLNTFTANNHKNVYVANLKNLNITEYGKITTAGEPLFIFDGTQMQMNLARYPNKGETLTPLLTAGCVIEQSKVLNGASSLYNDYTKGKANGWKLRIDAASAYRARLAQWTLPNSTSKNTIWMYGALYEEWHRAHYPLVIDKDAWTMSSTVNSEYGIKDAVSGIASRNGYFYNILEELDTDGEWYLDHDTGMLYVYSSKKIAADARAAIVSDTHDILTLLGASNVVLNGITFAETLGRGLLINGCENVLVQNCTFRDTRSNACAIGYSYNSGVIASDFSRTSTSMLMVVGTNDRKTMTPDRIFVQNCTFHDPDPIVQRAIDLKGISCLVSHNLFEQTTVTFNGAECVLEYNEFDQGSQITRDSGPVYCSGPAVPKGNHIRYNYIHDLNYSGYGIYIDDLASDNYVYSNIVTYSQAFRNEFNSEGRCVNIHNGHQNVVYNNICVNAGKAGVRDDVNYYLQTVKGTNGTAIATRYYRYYTAANGTQSTEESTVKGGALTGWNSLMTTALNTYDEKYGGASSRYTERFPNLAIYMELARIHLNAAHADEEHDFTSATIAWNLTKQSGTKYAWGNDSLYDFLTAKTETQDIEVYLRSPAYNEYVGNIFLGCATDIESYTPWGVLTTNVKNNYGLPATSKYFTQAMNGDLSEITQASTWQGKVSDFETIPYERFGKTKLSAVELFVVTDENFDIEMPFDQLVSKK